MVGNNYRRLSYSTNATTLGFFLLVLTLGGTSAEGAGSWGLGWGWGCGSVRAGVDDEDDSGDDDDDGRWRRDSWLFWRWRFSKLGVSGSVKECDRDTTGGVTVEFDEATLLLLFKAARWERTLRTTQNRTQWGSAGQSACRVFRQGTSSGTVGYFKGFVTFELMLVTLTLDFSNVEIRAMQVLLVIVRLFWVIHN